MTGRDPCGAHHLDIILLGVYCHDLEYCSTCVWKCCMMYVTGMTKMSSLSEQQHVFQDVVPFVMYSNLCTPSGGDEVKQTSEQEGYCEKNRKKVST